MKTNPNHLLVVLIILFSSYQVTGQKLSTKIEPSKTKNAPFNSEFCATDFFHNQKMESDPEYNRRYLQTKEVINKISSQQNKISNSNIYQIPVVVHVMHKGEPVGNGTNISNKDVKRGIEYLNNYWRKVSGSNGFGEGVDMQIEFALAVQDENGNCTDGIDRVDMSGVTAYVSNGVNVHGSAGIDDYLSSGGINSLKEYSIWDTNKYYNIWIVDEIDNKNCSSSSFTAGYAYYASAHGQPQDGVVILICSYLDESSTTLAHEIGHAFNLLHTFDGDNNGTTCGDDGIFDTPSHKRTSSISPSIYFDCSNSDANTCDPTFNQVINPETGFTRNSGTHQDHMHNYMDYTGCPTEFTGGQRAVVKTALTGTRASFLTSPALTPPSTAAVNFTTNASSACLGNTLTFKDESSCTPNTFTNTGYNNISFLWTIDNGVDPAYTSTDQNPSITFNNLGTYNVTLQITNSHGVTSLTKANYIYVINGVVPGCSISSFNNNNDYNNGVTNVSFNTLNNATSTFIPSTAMQDFTCSYNTTISTNTSYNLNVSYKSRSNFSQYLEVWIDWDNSGVFETTNSNGTNELVLTDNIPASSVGTPSASITPPATATLNTLLRMRVLSEANSSPNMCGNGFIQRADDYGVRITSTTLSIKDFSNSKFQIYPNPAQDYLIVSLEVKDIIRAYEIYDITGKKVLNSSKIDQKLINIAELPSGFYVLKLKTDNAVLMGKFIKK